MSTRLNHLRPELVVKDNFARQTRQQQLLTIREGHVAIALRKTPVLKTRPLATGPAGLMILEKSALASEIKQFKLLSKEFAQSRDITKKAFEHLEAHGDGSKLVAVLKFLPARYHNSLIDFVASTYDFIWDERKGAFRRAFSRNASALPCPSRPAFKQASALYGERMHYLVVCALHHYWMHGDCKYVDDLYDVTPPEYTAHYREYAKVCANLEWRYYDGRFRPARPRFFDVEKAQRLSPTGL